MRTWAESTHNIWVTVGCLLGVGFSTSLLVRDIQSTGIRIGTPMAKLERAQQKVRLKPASSFIWGNIKTNEKLYRKDSIQTTPKGGASVRFTDGRVLEIGENSLIILDDIENLSLGFLRGSAVVHSESGDSKITIDQNGKTSIEQLPVRLISPEPLAQFFTTGKTPKTIPFAWELNLKAGQSAPDSVQISSERNFPAGHFQTLSIPAQSKTLSTALIPGKYFWRVVAHDHPLTEPSLFQVETAEALKPLFPIHSEKVPLFGGSGPVQFRWKAEDNAIVHHIEIATDPEFKTIAQSKEIAAASGISSIKGLSTGEFYWRIVSEFPDSPNFIKQSPAEKFTVESISHVALELTKPDDGAVLKSGSQQNFGWKSDTNGLEYHWQIRPSGDAPDSASDSSRANTVTTSAKGYLWKQPSVGTFQWRVQAVIQDQVVGESGWRIFSAIPGEPIALLVPTPHESLNYWSEPSTFKFKWRKIAEASRYAVEVASTPDFKDASKVETPDTEMISHSFSIKPGSLFWRVSGLNSSNQLVSTSLTSEFKFGPYPLLRAPASAQPEAGAVLNPIENEKDPVIRWAPVEGARAYEISVKQGDRPLLQQVLPSTSAVLTGLKPGRYSYSVRAIDQNQRRGEPLPERPFEITFGKPLSAPEALSPEVQ